MNTTDPSESNHSMKILFTIPSTFVIFLTSLKNDETKEGGKNTDATPKCIVFCWNIHVFRTATELRECGLNASYCF